ncbi:MAG TPA: hypothetical protein VFU73_08075 [Actinocrinis sp.]|nr:hypothetical protein [Actinocrinis sp.]
MAAATASAPAGGQTAQAAQAAEAAGGPPPAGRLRTPARLAVALGCAVLAMLGLGAAAATTLAGRQSTATSTTYASEPLVVYVQELYQDLADADAAAAASILAGQVPPAALTSRYRADINDAEKALAYASRAVAGDDEASGELADVSTFLPQYTALIGVAEANNRQGYPVGAAYLRTASNALRTTTLPEVKAVVARETAAAQAGRSSVSGFPSWLLIVALLAALVVVRVWRVLARATRRAVNPGLAVGALITAGVVIWAFAAALGAGRAMDSAGGDFTRVSALLDQRATLARAQTDQAFTLIDRGEDGGQDATNQADAINTLKAAAGGDPLWKAYFSAVDTFNKDVQGSNYLVAVDESVGSGASQGNGATFAAAAALDKTLVGASNAAQDRFTRDGHQAVGDLSGGLWAGIVVGLLAAALAALGINRRLAEYR